MSNKELIANLRGENLDCNCCAYSRSECSCLTHWPESFCDEAADALEAADKRIAELEAKIDEAYKKGYATGEEESERRIAELEAELADRLSPGMALTLKSTIREAERKLAVSLEAMEEAHDASLDEDHRACRLILKTALAQIGGEDESG